jgi:3'-phosphoadenosine 5'-phosphosulfate sulfotransferase (PAPS reductase)/FAD synthetase
MERQSNNSLMTDIMEVEGFSNITAKQFVDNFDDFKKFMKKLNIKTHNLEEYIKKSKIKKNIVFTGFRNNELEKVLEKNGIAVNSSINSDTVFVIKKDSSSQSSKIKEAEKKKIKVMTLDTFLKNKDKFIKST